MQSNTSDLAILYLHALPLDGSMWNLQRRRFNLPSYAPTLYGFGESVTEWAAAALALVEQERTVLVGCSVGGSCALEIARLAPDRVAALVLTGTKADITPQPAFLASALETIHNSGPETAWRTYWQPLISGKSPAFAQDVLKWIYDRRSPDELACGTKAFHTRPGRLDVLERFEGGVSVITGGDDIAPGPQTSKTQADSARHGSLHVLPDCGHYTPVEAPEAFNTILLETLRSCLPGLAFEKGRTEQAFQS